MSVLRKAALATGVGLSCTQISSIAQSDTVPSHTSWLDWLIRPSPPQKHDTEMQNPEPMQTLQQSPGRVFVWGGSFGKTPREIKSLGNKCMQVAACDGIGAAIHDNGTVHAFSLDTTSDRAQSIPLRGGAKQIAIREGAQQLVILSDTGGVYVSHFTRDGVFQPVEQLGGALRRARVKKVRCGKEHCIAITRSGEAISWGSTNSHGQLANGSVGDVQRGEQLPQRVQMPDGVKVDDAACGNRHTLFVDAAGTIYATGDDKWAQLGISAEPWAESHQKMSGCVRKAELLNGLAAQAIVAGGQHTLVLVRDGTVFSCGFNQFGQLGHHNYSSLAPPSPIADYNLRAIAITAGENHSCVVLDRGEMRCIGGNAHGQLGLGTLQPSMAWKKVKVDGKSVKPTFVSSSGNVCAVIVEDLKRV